jgi:steroid delta-isomerase-like uncharacterized protein
MKENTVSIEANKAVVRRFLEEMNHGNLAIADELLAEDLVRYLPGSAKPVNRATSDKVEVAFYVAFPDLVSTIEEMVAEDDRVTARITARGTHTGSFQGIAPTGRAIVMTEIFIARIRDGKIAELRAEADLLGLFQQLGSMPAAARATA